MAIRAYTYIDHARARVGNSWLDRNWSGFLGTTASLLDRRGRFDWLSRPGGGFAVQVAGEMLDALALGENAWSERNDPAGATLTQVKSNGSVEVRIETRAFHEHAGMMRQLQLRNLTPAPVQVARAVVEELALVAGRLEPATVNTPALPGFAPWRPGPRAALAVERGRGLLLAGAEPLALALADRVFRFALDAPVDLLPSGNVSLPPTFAFAFEAAPQGPEPFGLAQQNAFFDFLRACDVLDEPRPEVPVDEPPPLSWPPEPTP